jgi:hypothetical protein
MCKEEAESGHSGEFPHRGKKASADFKRKTSTEVKQEADSLGMRQSFGAAITHQSGEISVIRPGRTVQAGQLDRK